MKIAYFSSEVYPYAKTGGLADVAGALPTALGEMGHEVRVFMPWYKGIEPQFATKRYGWSHMSENVEIVFVKNDLFFKRDHLYNMPTGDYGDNLLRFTYFCKEAMAIMKDTDFKADIYHANDWQTALVPLLVRMNRKDDPFYAKARAVYTIHNMAFQGCFDARKFESLGLSPEFEGVLDLAGGINFMKGAVLCADAVNTVSPSYAAEIRTAEFGVNLQYIMQLVAPKSRGILNGVDYRVWDPAHDQNIEQTYTKSDADKGKAANKAALMAEFRLKKKKGGMLLGMVSRLSAQKGVDLLIEVLPQMLKKHSVVILGSGDLRYHEELAELCEAYPDSLAVVHDYNDRLSHKIYAASDLFLMPSRFEPCGLSQLISFKYGTLPLVYATGGLEDTVKDLAPDAAKGNGFVFSDHTKEGLTAAFKRAEQLFKTKAAWDKAVTRAMGAVFSWTKAAEKYDEMYRSVA